MKVLGVGVEVLIVVELDIEGLLEWVHDGSMFVVQIPLVHGVQWFGWVQDRGKKVEIDCFVLVTC